MEIPSSFFHVSFNKAMAFGYKTDDVDVFVTQAIQYIEGLQEENSVLMDKMGILADNLSKYREEEDSLRSALVGAQKLGDSILRDCRSKAETILRDATLRADKVTQEAALELARTQYELESLKTETTEFKEKLFALYRTHLDHINSLPSNKELADRHRKTPPPPPPPPAAAAEPEPYDEEPVQGGGHDAPHEQPEYDQADYSHGYDEPEQYYPAPDVTPPIAQNDDLQSYDLEPKKMREENEDTDQPVSDKDFDDKPVVEYTEVEYEEDAPATRYVPDEITVNAVADADPDPQEEDVTTYKPRTRRNESRRNKGVFSEIPMVQMEFFGGENEEDDGDDLFTDTENLRSVDLDKIPYFDDEDEEEEGFGTQPNGGKHRISKKFGELKFGDSFSLTDD